MRGKLSSFISPLSLLKPKRRWGLENGPFLTKSSVRATRGAPLLHLAVLFFLTLKKLL
jgi:hypothetical protein